MTTHQIKCLCGTLLTVPENQASVPFVCPRCARKLAIGPTPARPAPAAIPAPSEPARWYLARDKKKLGPYSSAQLKEMADAGALQPQDMIWREGRQKWVNAGAVKGLFRGSPADGQAAYAPPPAANPFAELQLLPVAAPVAPVIGRVSPSRRRGIWLALGGGGCLAVIVLAVILAVKLIGGPGKDAQGDKRKKLDLSYIAADFNAAIIVHPARMLERPALAKLADDKSLADMIKQTGIDPRKVEQLVVLIDPFPAGNVPVLPAFIFRFREAVEGEALVKKILEKSEKQEYKGKPFFRGTSEKIAGVAGCAYVADERTLLAAPEPTLKKMLDAEGARSPLLEYLPTVDIDHDIIAAFVMDQIEAKQNGPTVRKALDEALGRAKKSLPPNFEGAEKIAEQLKAATLTLDLAGDVLLSINLEATSEDAAASLHKLATRGHDFLKVAAPAFNQQLAGSLPPDLAKPVSALVEELVGGITLSKDGNHVMLTLKMPKELPGLLEKAPAAFKDFAPKPPPPGLKKGPPHSGKK